MALLHIGKTSIRKQLLFGFLSITSILLLTVISSLIHLKHATEIRNLESEVFQTEILLLKQINTQRYFLENEVVDSALYISGENSFLSSSRKQGDEIYHQINQIIADPQIQKFGLHQAVVTTFQDFHQSDELFLKIVVKQRERGFKDWGLIGEMRHHAHLLESENFLSLEKLLMLRRHEKDYFLRKQSRYIENFNKLCDDLSSQLPIKSQAYLTLKAYKKYFNQVVDIEQEIGNIHTPGMKTELFQLGSDIIERFTDIAQKANTRGEDAIGQIKIWYLFSIIASVLLSIGLSYLISHKMTKPIRRLDAEMTAIMQDPEKLDYNVKLKGAANEVRNLNKAFRKLITRLGVQFEELKAQSEDLQSKNDELTKVNSELDQFVYSASHDLRSPLTSSLGLLQIIKLEKDHKQKEISLALLEKSLNKLNSFTGEILSLSRNSRTEVEHKPVDLTSLVSEIFDQQQVHNPSNPVKLQLEIIEEIALITDPRRMRMIFNNLISNAIRYHRSQEPSPFVLVKVKIDDDQASIEVTDNGQGIAKEHQKDIFKMFYRATTENHGSGLGLYIVKEAIKKLNGDIEVSSEVNKGTSFKINIPNMVKVRKLTGAEATVA